MNPNYLNILGLAHRARKCTIGEELIIKDIKKQRAKLVLIANDIGKQTKKKLMDKCNFYQIPYLVVDDRKTLAQALGKSQTVAVAVTDQGFAKKLKSLVG